MSRYQQTLDFLYSQLPMYQRVGNVAFKKGLGNTKVLLSALGNPHKSFRAVHIAGTNGKGTVSHMLAAMYQAKGLKVGLYTSPHYRDFRERIRINGIEVSKKFIVDFVDRIDPVIREIKPSFFEITVAMAFEAFAQEQVDLAIIETGLGGRLDSTNVITPEISVITNIDFDHMEMLGDTITKIAREKAGIIKRDVPVVIGEWEAESAAVFKKKAAKSSSGISFANRSLTVDKQVIAFNKMLCTVKKKGHVYFDKLELGIAGPFHATNLVTSLKTVEVLGQRNPDLMLSEEDIRVAMWDIVKLTGYKGRWQVLSESPLVVCDSAHNAQGLRGTMNYLLHLPGKKHLVIGFVREKKLDDILKLLPGDATYYFCSPNVPRGLPVEELLVKTQQAGLRGKGYASVGKAKTAAQRAAKSDEIIFIGGSSFVVAEVV